MKDTDIIAYLLNGNINRAVKGLYNFFPDIRKMVITNSGSREDAEDVFQEAMMVLYCHCRQKDFILNSSLRTYVYAIARNKWYMELRRRKKEIPFVVNAYSEGATDAEEERWNAAENAFMMLGEKCREILLMFYLRKMSMSQIASAMGFSSEQVAKNQKYRCVEKAKLHLMGNKDH